MSDETRKILTWASREGGIDIGRLHFGPTVHELAVDLELSGLLVRRGSCYETSEIGRACLRLAEIA